MNNFNSVAHFTMTQLTDTFTSKARFPIAVAAPIICAAWPAVAIMRHETQE
jgi:hypothetical protein